MQAKQLNNSQYETLLQQVFQTENGKALLKLLIQRRFVGTMFVTETMEIARQEGQRQFLRELLKGLSEEVKDSEEFLKLSVYNPF